MYMCNVTVSCSHVRVLFPLLFLSQPPLPHVRVPIISFFLCLDCGIHTSASVHFIDSVLQCVAVCCSVLQCVAVCCSVLQCIAVYCSVLQCVAVCCSVSRCVAVCCSERVESNARAHQSAACGGVLQCIAVCCSVWQCVAACRDVSR